MCFSANFYKMSFFCLFFFGYHTYALARKMKKINKNGFYGRQCTRLQIIKLYLLAFTRIVSWKYVKVDSLNTEQLRGDILDKEFHVFPRYLNSNRDVYLEQTFMT